MLRSMLHYLGYGERRYFQKPITTNCRNVWEFQAVVHGRIQALYEDRAGPLRAQSLWVFGPKCPHGWNGERHKPARVCVFQFASVPMQLQDALAVDDSLCVALDRQEGKELQQQAARAQAELLKPSSLAFLSHQRLLLDLTLLVLGKADAGRFEPVQQHAPRQQVDTAMAWFREHLSQAPSQSDVANSINCSVAHLRRLFHRVLGAAPRDVLEQIRFQVACELLCDASMSLDAIAEKCGLGSASAFSRAFSKRLHISPSAWRAAQESTAWNDGQEHSTM